MRTIILSCPYYQQDGMRVAILKVLFLVLVASNITGAQKGINTTIQHEERKLTSDHDNSSSSEELEHRLIDYLVDAHVYHQNDSNNETTENVHDALGSLDGLIQGQGGSRSLGGNSLKKSAERVHKQTSTEASEGQPSSENNQQVSSKTYQQVSSKTYQQVSSKPKKVKGASAQKNFSRYRFHANSLDELPFLRPKDGNISTEKWKGSHWTSRSFGSINGTHGNWSKGFRQRGLWVGTEGAGGKWMQEGIFNGFWSVTKSLGHRLLEQFWTTNHHSQMNVTIGNFTSVFNVGNSTSGNSTKEVAKEDMANLVNSPDEGSMGP